MGKKSKRRGGGGGVGKKNGGALNSRDRSDGDQLTASGGTLATADTDTLFSAEEAAALLRVPTPSSFKGIISTNDQPGKCVYCLSDLLHRTSRKMRESSPTTIVRRQSLLPQLFLILFC